MNEQKHTISDSFDFDYWLELARTDPDLFEWHRQAAIKAYLSDLPSARRSRLERLQWRIDMEIRRSSSHLGACIRLYQMMLESCSRQQAALDALLQGTEMPDADHQAEVLPFARGQS
ncbi:MAG TPA: DUF3135 domain-containing protein [Methylothermaceae bacterium]|nr:DUF3135 domain-containing protein [Methylothermaceae bacterium]